MKQGRLIVHIRSYNATNGIIEQRKKTHCPTRSYNATTGYEAKEIIRAVVINKKGHYKTGNNIIHKKLY
ncbi:hypothetical protein KSS87_022287, partial [Heliosperma pusillum]